MNTAITTRPAFDACALKCQFPGLADPTLHYLDNAATAQMPEVVLGALRRFETWSTSKANCLRLIVPIDLKGNLLSKLT